jgi:hypothetical protein
MIIVPSLNARKILPTNVQTLLYAAWRKQQFQHLPLEQASYAYVFSKLDAPASLKPMLLSAYQLMLKQCPKWLEQRQPCWLQQGLIQLQSTLREDNLYLPGEEDHLAYHQINQRESDLQYFQLDGAADSAVSLLSLCEAKVLRMGPITQLHEHIVFSSVDHELKAALHWQSKKPENRTVLAISPTSYHEANLRISPSIDDEILVKDILLLLAPEPLLSQELSHMLNIQKHYSQNKISQSIYQPMAAIQTPTQIPFGNFRKEVIQQLEHYGLLTSSHPAVQEALKCIKTMLGDIAMLQKNVEKLSYNTWHQHLSEIQQFHISKQGIKSLSSFHNTHPEVWLLGFNQDALATKPASAWIPDLPTQKPQWEMIYQVASHLITSSPEKNDHGEKHLMPAHAKPQSLSVFQPEKSAIVIEQEIDHHQSTSNPKILSASKVQDYAQCPFKAFARHQLKLQAQSNECLQPQSLEIGNLVHQSLEVLYESVKAQSDLLLIKPEQITQVISQQWEALNIQTHPQLAQILQVELAKRIQQWIAIDLERPEFTVDSLESKYVLKLNQDIQIQMRVDRIDQVGHQAVIIDYKTGYANIADALNPKFTSPQLPLYALTQTYTPQIAYALIQHTPSLQSLDLSDQTAVNKRQSLRGYPTVCSDTLKAEWKEKAMTLVGHYHQGHFSADPASALICQLCEFSSICRKNLLS